MVVCVFPGGGGLFRRAKQQEWHCIVAASMTVWMCVVGDAFYILKI
jgi:hypothetical protein